MRSLLTISVFFFFFNLNAQDHGVDEQAAHEEQGHQEKYRVAFTSGMTHIPEAFEEGHEEDAVFVPTVGLDLFYYINHKWSVSFIADIELADYVIALNRDYDTRC